MSHHETPSSEITKFVASWHATDHIKSACLKAGMEDGDGTSFWDWVRQEDFEEHTVHPTFDAAKALAFSIKHHDCFGAPRVEKFVWVGKKRDGYWDRICFWEIEDGNELETEPTFTDEAE